MGDNRSRCWWARWCGFALLFGVMLCACADKEKSQRQAAGAPAIHVIPGGKLADLSAPAHVVAFGGTDHAAQSIRQLRTFIAAASPSTPPAAVVVQMMVRRELGLKSAVALDLSRPMRFAVIDPKKYPVPHIVMIAVKERQELVESLPADRKRLAGAVGWSYRQEAPLFLHFIDKFAVFTHSETVFGQTQDFLAKLLGATVQGELGLVVLAKHVDAIFGDDLARVERTAEKKQKEATKERPAETHVQPLEWMSAARTTVRQLDRAILKLSLTDDSARLSAALHPQKESGLQQRIAALGTRRPALLASLAPDAAAVFAMAVPADSGGWVRRFTEWTMGLSSSRPLDPKFRQALDQYWAATDGQMALAMQTSPEAKRLGLVSLTGLRDAQAARKASTVLRGLRTEPGATHPHGDGGLKTTPSAYRIGDVSVDTVGPAAKPSRDRASPPRLGTTFLTSLKTHHLAITDDQVVMFYGEGAEPSMRAWLGGQRRGGLGQSAAIKAVMKHAPPGVFLLAYASPLSLVRGGVLGEDNSALANAVRQMTAPKAGISFSAGATEGVLRAVLELPSKQLEVIARLLTLSQGGR